MKHQRQNVRTPGRTPGRTPSRPRGQRSKENLANDNSLDPVEVYCRIRPLDINEDEKCVKMADDTTVKVASCDPKVQVEMQYKFTKVFGETASQKYLFDCVGAPLIDDLVRGKNSLLFTYGITSSGKTYTMTGQADDQGILPRCLDMVFNSIENLQARKYVFMPDRQNGFDIQTEADAMLERQQREILPLTGKSRQKESQQDYGDREKDPSKVLDIDEDCNYAIFVSFIEIYNNYIYDLLEELPPDPITGSKPPHSKILREDLQRVMFVHNVSEVEVKSTEEAFDILAKGQKRRKVAHTVLNAESSRSHSVFNIRLVQAPLDPTGKELLMDKNRIVVSQLSLVDLAGSERTNRTKNSGDRLKEAGQINQSLMVLRQCIDLLRDNQKNGANKMVPYRESKITHLFKNYFDGEGKVRMIVCVNPRAVEFDETLHVMRFSEATQEVQVHRAQEKPKLVEDGFIRGRRRMAAQGIDLVPPPPAKKPSLESLPHAPVPIKDIYSLPPFPKLHFNAMDTGDADLHQLRDYLQHLHTLKEKQLSTVQRKQESFRNLLQAVDRDNSRLHNENMKLGDSLRECESANIDQSKENDRLTRRLQAAEKEIRNLRQRISQYEKDKRELADELHSKDFELCKTDYQRERERNAYEKKVAQAEAAFENQLEAEKQKIQQQAQENLSVKERKLRLLKNIVNMSDVESLAGDVPAEHTPTSHNVRTKPPLPNNSTPQTSSYATPTQSSLRKENERSRPATRSTKTPTTRLRAKSPPVSSKPAVVRNHRRSRSTGERWLDHRPEQLQALDTVFQPKMKKKKSVGKLEVKDTNKASKYILTTQGHDGKGHLETKLVKGEVKASPGGGSCVTFTEVETLKQTSPGDRRRRYIQESKDDYEGEWTDTEERCNVAIEGHGVYSRIRQFDKKPGAAV